MIAQRQDLPAFSSRVTGQGQTKIALALLIMVSGSLSLPTKNETLRTKH
jgi:hypothetical protein